MSILIFKEEQEPIEVYTLRKAVEIVGKSKTAVLKAIDDGTELNGYTLDVKGDIVTIDRIRSVQRRVDLDHRLRAIAVYSETMYTEVCSYKEASDIINVGVESVRNHLWSGTPTREGYFVEDITSHRRVYNPVKIKKIHDDKFKSTLITSAEELAKLVNVSLKRAREFMHHGGNTKSGYTIKVVKKRAK